MRAGALAPLVLHLVNGATTDALLDRAGVPGERVEWGDMLAEGPWRDVVASREARAERMRLLEERFGVPPERYDRAMARTLEAFDALPRHEEVVLWFEEDLFCQLNLVAVLAAVDGRGPPPARLSLVCPERAIGHHGPDEVARMFERRGPVTAARIALAREASAALASPDPRALEDLAGRGDFSAWPHLRDGLLRQLARLPSSANGLGVPEEGILRAVARAAGDGEAGFEDAYRRYLTDPDLAAYGFGDAQLARALIDLARARRPLAHVTGDDPATMRARVTDAGRFALAGELDHVDASGVDRWVGGVRLLGTGPLPRWDGRRVVA